MQNAQEIYLGTIAKLPRDEQWQLANLIFEQLRRTENQAERLSVYDLLKSLPKNRWSLLACLIIKRCFKKFDFYKSKKIFFNSKE